MIRSLGLSCFAGLAGAQDPAPGPQSRTEEIEQLRRAKEKTLQPDQLPKGEQALNEVRDRQLIERFTAGVAGVRLKMGGLATGSGFALGPEYVKTDLGRAFSLRSSAQASFRRWYIVDLELDAPDLANRRSYLNMKVAHRNYASLNYYGPGADSERNGRANFRFEDQTYDFTTGYRPWSSLRLGILGGFSQVNTGPGNDRRFASLERIYSNRQAPGIDDGTSFLRGGFELVHDTRDTPGGARKGGFHMARWTYFRDNHLRHFTFRRLELEAQRYYNFFEERRVLAFRARSVLHDTNKRNLVPVYYQAVVGGADDLRGFRPFRFYDNHSIILNGEYRWEVFSGLDGAVFADGGKVFHRLDDWNKRNFEGSFGFGLRFNVRNSVFMRIDTGFSREGFQIWFKFNDSFTTNDRP
ncbi:MAG: hypothetical protein FJW40_21870 [Acidobacteria bacterium]|nr:hypothetical protein [Acidobacteriota bacterium]